MHLLLTHQISLKSHKESKNKNISWHWKHRVSIKDWESLKKYNGKYQADGSTENVYQVGGQVFSLQDLENKSLGLE